MGKFITKIVKTLQLDHKWVRVMLSFSLVAILAITVIPQREEKKILMSVKEYTADSLSSQQRNEIAMVEREKQKYTADSLREIYTQSKVFDTTIITADSMRTRMIVRKIDKRQPVPPPPPKSVDRRIASVEDTVIKQGEPLQVQIVSEPKPFDWKGTITWGIGVINGLVLAFMNVKNFFKPKV